MRQTGVTFTWWTVGDDRVCPDCQGREGASHTMAEWRAIYGTPGSALAGTMCGEHCRCALIPDSLKAQDLRELIEKAIDEAVEEAMGGLKVDMRTGRTVKLKHLEQFEGMYTVKYSEIANMESLIHQWKAQHGTLPKEFFALADLEKMTKWLKANMKVPPPPAAPKPEAKSGWNENQKRANDLGIERFGQEDILKTGNQEQIASAIKWFEKLKKAGYEFNYKGFYVEFKPNAYAASSSTGFLFGKNFIGKTIKEFEAHLKKDVSKGWHPDGCDVIESVWSHEFAHMLTINEILAKGEAYKAFFSIKSKYTHTVNKLKKKFADPNSNWDVVQKEWESIFISEYARKNMDEFVAEAFAMALHSKHPSPFALQVKAVIDKHFKKKGKK